MGNIIFAGSVFIFCWIKPCISFKRPRVAEVEKGAGLFPEKATRSSSQADPSPAATNSLNFELISRRAVLHPSNGIRFVSQSATNHTDVDYSIYSTSRIVSTTCLSTKGNYANLSFIV